jgi:putative ATPase
MRPRTLDEYAGQDHIIGPGRLLRRAIQLDQLSSIILYGPPGTGKTTLARVIANTTKRHFVTINAVLSGVKEIREAIDKARELVDLYDQKTILFVDEVHRWNKSQQDALLPWVENGTFTLIGATIENPFFEVNRALVSRSRIFQLVPLTNDDLVKIVRQALADPERGYGRYDVRIDEDALDHLVRVANGDARSLLNALELAVETTPAEFPPSPGTEILISLEIAEQSIQKKAVFYDKEGDYHFDTISAFIKSLRGSDPDAALYWLAKMVAAGEDPRFVFRRMLILASEDVGLADPNAIVEVNALAAAYERVGLPEGRFFLTQAALYLATCRKSNSTLGFFDALRVVEEEKEADVPDHLRDASRDRAAFGHGEGYLYPHSYRDHWVAQAYLPASLAGRVFYKPSGVGYEAEIRDDVTRRREAQLAAAFDVPASGSLSFTPRVVLSNVRADEWSVRTSDAGARMLLDIRDRVFARIALARTSRVFDCNAQSGLFVWEALRRTPEGSVYCLVEREENLVWIEHYARLLPDVERPVIVKDSFDAFSRDTHPEIEPGLLFDAIVGRNVFVRCGDKSACFVKMHDLLARGGMIALSEIVPSRAARLSGIVGIDAFPDAGFHDRFVKIEEKIYARGMNPLFSWNESDIEHACASSGFVDMVSETVVYEEEREIRETDLDRWFARSGDAGSNYGNLLASDFTEDERKSIRGMFVDRLVGRVTRWPRTVLFISACRD